MDKVKEIVLERASSTKASVSAEYNQVLFTGSLFEGSGALTCIERIYPMQGIDDADAQSFKLATLQECQQALVTERQFVLKPQRSINLDERRGKILHLSFHRLVSETPLAELYLFVAPAKLLVRKLNFVSNGADAGLTRSVVAGVTVQFVATFDRPLLKGERPLFKVRLYQQNPKFGLHASYLPLPGDIQLSEARFELSFQSRFVGSRIAISAYVSSPVNPNNNAQSSSICFAQITSRLGISHQLSSSSMQSSMGKPVMGESQFLISKANYKQLRAEPLLRELNIRLAGFGGNVPSEEFDDRTSSCIKQFERDYMKQAATGEISAKLLKAVDAFSNQYSFPFDEIKCKCGFCEGFGDGSYKGIYLKHAVEAYHRYEYPGLHRSLLWGMKAMLFYLERDGRYTLAKVSSGYRCRRHPEYLKRASFNHMGKAMDLHFNKAGLRTRAVEDMERIRKEIFYTYLGARWDWKADQRNIFNMESTKVGAVSWVHFDVREFNQIYLQDRFFAKNESDAWGEPLVAMALRLGLKQLFEVVENPALIKVVEPSSIYRYPLAHSEFGNLIARHESADNYNICNCTKGGLRVVRDLQVVEMSIRQIQQKQANREIFAVGRYQLIPTTLESAVLSLGLDRSALLDAEMQDRIFECYLIKVKRPEICRYFAGAGTVEEAMYAAAKEWASIGVERGRRISDKRVQSGGVVSYIKRYAEGGESYYAGDGLNKAHISPLQIREAFIKSKNENGY